MIFFTNDYISAKIFLFLSKILKMNYKISVRTISFNEVNKIWISTYKLQVYIFNIKLYKCTNTNCRDQFIRVHLKMFILTPFKVCENVCFSNKMQNVSVLFALYVPHFLTKSNDCFFKPFSERIHPPTYI